MTRTDTFRTVAFLLSQLDYCTVEGRALHSLSPQTGLLIQYLHLPSL